MFEDKKKLYKKAKELVEKGNILDGVNLYKDLLSTIEKNGKHNKYLRAIIFNDLGKIWEEHGDINTAANFYKKAIFAYPLFEDAFWNLIKLVGDKYRKDDFLISIVFTTYNRRPYLEKCIYHLRKNTFFRYEIIVVSDPCDDGTEEFLEQESKKGDLIYIANPSHYGIADSLNTGFSLAKGNYIAVGNDDAYVLPGWDLFAIDTIDQDKTIGCAASLVVSPEGYISHPGSYDPFKSNRYPWIGQVPYLNVECFRSGTLEDFLELQHPRACNYALFPIFKRFCLEAIKIDGLVIDPQFKHYFQDNDIGFRIQEKGLKTIYCPLSVIIHLFLKPTNQLLGNYKFLVDQLRFFKKWDITIDGQPAYAMAKRQIIKYINTLESQITEYENTLQNLTRELHAA